MTPMHEPDLAAREAERAAGLPGVRGFYLATRVNERELSDESFFPVYERIESLGLPVFLHPVFVLAPERLAKIYLPNLPGNTLESGGGAAAPAFRGGPPPRPRLRGPPGPARASAAWRAPPGAAARARGRARAPR